MLERILYGEHAVKRFFAKVASAVDKLLLLSSGEGRRGIPEF